MRILFLSNLYPPYELGGYEQWCQEMQVGLKSRGHTVKVLTSDHGVQPGEGKSSNGDVIRSLHLQTDINYYRPLDFFLKRSIQEQANIQELRRVMAEFQPDLVMVWGMWNLSLNLPYYAEQWLPGRVVYFISSYWPLDVDLHTQYWTLPTNHRLAEAIKRPLRTLALSQLRREKYPPELQFEHAVCCSWYVRNTLIKEGKLSVSAGVLYGGTDPAQFKLNEPVSLKPAQSPLRLLYFGRLIHDKGVHTAIEALGLLKQQGLADKIKLTILGSGHPDYEAHLRAMVARLAIENLVDFAERVPREEIPAWLRRFDVFLFTSIWPEPMARSVMEAMMAGLLVIGSEVGGQVEMLNNDQNALTFQAEDAAGLAKQIGRLTNDPSLRLRLAKAGQQMALEKFTLSRMLDDIENYLFEILRSQTNATLVSD